MDTWFGPPSHTCTVCILAGTKYAVSVHRRASDTFSLTLGRSSVDAVIRTLNDGGLLVQASLLHCPALHCTAASHLIQPCKPALLALCSLMQATTCSFVPTLYHFVPRYFACHIDRGYKLCKLYLLHYSVPIMLKPHGDEWRDVGLTDVGLTTPSCDMPCQSSQVNPVHADCCMYFRWMDCRMWCTVKKKRWEPASPLTASLACWPMSQTLPASLPAPRAS